MKVIKGHELHLCAPDEVGLLATVAGRCRDAGIDILGISAYRRDNNAWFVLHTNDPYKAAEALADLRVIWQEVLIVDCPTEMGMLAGIAEKLASAGINILYCYGTACDSPVAKLVMDTSHNDRALEVLTK